MTKQSMNLISNHLEVANHPSFSQPISSKVCRVEDYRNPNPQVQAFLAKVGLDMVKKVAEYFDNTYDLLCHFVQYERCLCAYNRARRKSFKFLLRFCEDYYLPVPDINMTLDDMQFISCKNGFVNGFIEKYYEKDFSLVGNTEQVKRMNRKLDKLALTYKLENLYIDMTKGVDAINSFAFQNKMMYFYVNHQSALIPYPLGSMATKLRYKLLMFHYSFTVVKHGFRNYYYVVNEEDKDCFIEDLQEIAEEFNFSKYFVAEAESEYKLFHNAAYVNEGGIRESERLHPMNSGYAILFNNEEIKCSGILVDDIGRCYIHMGDYKYILEKFDSRTSFIRIKNMYPSQLRGIAYYYPHHARK